MSSVIKFYLFISLLFNELLHYKKRMKNNDRDRQGQGWNLDSVLPIPSHYSADKPMSLSSQFQKEIIAEQSQSLCSVLETESKTFSWQDEYRKCCEMCSWWSVGGSSQWYAKQWKSSLLSRCYEFLHKWSTVSVLCYAECYQHTLFLFTSGQKVRVSIPRGHFSCQIQRNHATLRQRQVVDACVALLNLAVSEQITERFQIIVRPVPALVIRHAVLSERKGSWWGKVTATWDSVVRSLRSDCFSQDTFWLAMALFLPGWYTVLAVFLSRYR